MTEKKVILFERNLPHLLRLRINVHYVSKDKKSCARRSTSRSELNRGTPLRFPPTKHTLKTLFKLSRVLVDFYKCLQAAL